MTPATWAQQVTCVLLTMALFALMLALNIWLFSHLEFARGINWIYLPAGTRLLCTLLFAEAGAVGLLLVSWLVSFFYFFPDQPDRAFVRGILAALGPYLVYLGARRAYGLQGSLANLTPGRLLVLCVACSLASPALHHIYFALLGEDRLLEGFVAMAIGDFTGTLIVLYTMKALLTMVPRRSP